VGGGRVWVAGRDGTVARIDPATNQVATTNIGLPATGIAVNEESIWVAVR
jgi:streptogramin lyase